MGFNVVLISGSENDGFYKQKICGNTCAEWVIKAAKKAGADNIYTDLDDSAFFDGLGVLKLEKELSRAVYMDVCMPLVSTESILKAAEIADGPGKAKVWDHVKNEYERIFVKDKCSFAKACKEIMENIRVYHMENGVTIPLPDSVIIEDDVIIGKDAVIEGNVIIRKGTKIAENAYIGAGCIIENSQIGDNASVIGSNLKDSVVSCGAHVLNSVLDNASVGENTQVGPFAYLRPKSNIGKNVRVGDFVEVKNSNVGDGTKISHLTYVGDSDVGKRVNFGCGTVTSNYDGKNKFRTVIGDDCFIGCNTNLVAPVSVEDGAYIAAGSTITDTVPGKSLAIARARQVIIDGWTDKRDK